MTGVGAGSFVSGATDAQRFLREMQRLAERALERWALDVIRIEVLKVRENAVFRLDLAGGRRAVLRIHRHGYHSNAALESEFTWLRALDGAGIRVPRVIGSRCGRDFELVPTDSGPDAEAAETLCARDSRQIDVFEWIEGSQLGSVEQGIAGGAGSIADQYAQIGVIAARLHNHGQRWPPPPGFHRHAWDTAGLVGEQPLWGRFWELEALRPEERRVLERSRSAITTDLEAYGRGADRYGLIHADLVPENLLVDGGRLCVIDFDDAGFGWHLFELATSLYFITDQDAFHTAREALIGGYRSERALADAALTRLSLFLAARGTTYLGWVHTREASETAQEMTPFLIERACGFAEAYMSGRRSF